MKRNGNLFKYIPHFELENLRFEHATKSIVLKESLKLEDSYETWSPDLHFLPKRAQPSPDIRLKLHFFDSLSSFQVEPQTLRLNHYARHGIYRAGRVPLMSI